MCDKFNPLRTCSISFLVFFFTTSLFAQWKEEPDLPVGRGEHANAIVGDKLYIMGGIFNSRNGPKAVDVYDLINGGWEQGVTDMPIHRNHFTIGATVYGDEIWVVGGKLDGPGRIGIEEVDVYNYRTNSWRSGPSLPIPIWGAPSLILNNKIHIIGGAVGNSNTLKTHYALDLTDTSAGWQQLADLPQARVHGAAVAYEGKIWFIGGEINHAHQGDRKTVQVYDPSTNSWDLDYPELPEARSHLEWATFVHQGNIYSVSGVNSANNPRAQETIYAYNSTSNQWTRLFDLPAKLASPGAKIHNNRLYVYGGGVNTWFGGDLEAMYSHPLVPDTSGIPVADAGDDQNQVGFTQVFLDGANSFDPNDPFDALDFQWVQIDGPTVSIINDDQAVANFQPIVAAEYTFSLMVSDQDSFGKDSVVVTISEPAIIDTNNTFSVPMIYWPMNEGDGNVAIDLIDGLEAVFVGGTSFVEEGAVFGGLNIDDGTAAEATFIDAFENNISISFWLKPSSWQHKEGRFVSKASSTSNNGHYWMVSQSDTTGLRFRLKTDNGGTEEVVVDDDLLSLDQWSFVVATYDGAQMWIYHNGVSVGSKSKTGAIVNDSNVAIGIGNQPNGAGNRPYDGIIDELKIYEIALSETEILGLYEQGNKMQIPCSDIAIIENPLAGGLYSNFNSISMHGSVQMNGNIIFSAQSFLSFEEGFSIPLGSMFMGIIENCITN